MKNEENVQSSFYTLIPAYIRFDKNLEPNAKLLFGDIAALCHQEGFCWASNNYFANLYQVGIRTIQKWILSLKEFGFIEVKISENGDERRIYIQKDFIKEKFSTPPMPKKAPPHAEKGTHNNTYIYTSNNLDNLPPLTPPLEVCSKEEEDSFEKERVLVKNEKGTTNANLISQQAPPQKLGDSKNNSTTLLNKSLNKPHYILSDVKDNLPDHSSRKLTQNKPSEKKYIESKEKEYSSLLSLFQFSLVQIRKLMQFTLDQIKKALEILATIKVKSSTFGLLFNILYNPLNYEKKTIIDVEKEKKNTQIQRDKKILEDRKTQCEKEAVALEKHYEKNNIPWSEYKDKTIKVVGCVVKVGNSSIPLLQDNFRDVYISMKKKFNLLEICKGF